jgi:hypothetical protein
MPSRAHFKITGPAEEFIRRSFSSGTPANSQHGLMRALGYEQRTPKGQLEEKFQGEHFLLCHERADYWRRAGVVFRLDVAGHELCITRDVAEALGGRTLAVRSRRVGRGKRLGATRELLVSV